MKREDILDAIGMVEDEYVKKAKEKKLKKPMWIRVALVAACFVFLILLATLLDVIKPVVYDELRQQEDKVNNENKIEIGDTEIAIEPAEVEEIRIYYVEGNEIKKEQVALPATSKSVFAKWKEKNKIGDEVELIQVKIDSDGTTTTYEFEGEMLVEHEMGNYFVYNITVTENLKEYYDKIPSNLLLESLKKTMTGFSNIQYDEYHLYFAQVE